jgi:thiamine biosynthesis lipoprotein
MSRFSKHSSAGLRPGANRVASPQRAGPEAGAPSDLQPLGPTNDPEALPASQKLGSPWSFRISGFEFHSSFVIRPSSFAFLLLALALCGCRTAPSTAAGQRYQFQQPHMGTLFTLTLYAANEAAATTAAGAAAARIEELSRTMTDYDPESELMRLSRSPTSQPVPLSADLFAILQQSQQFAQLSSGAFDITVGPYVRHWRRARRTGQLPSPEVLARAAESVGWQKLRLDAAARTATLLAPNMQLDLGGIAKGWAADAALATLRQHGCPRAMVAASGDIAVGDPPPGTKGWRVGVGIPGAADTRTARELLLANAALSTSGDTEQFVEIGGTRYSHILDPRTGLGLTNHVQASVIAPCAAQTDPLATAVCVLGWRAGLAIINAQPYTAALVILRANGANVLLESTRFPALPIASSGRGGKSDESDRSDHSASATQ